MNRYTPMLSTILFLIAVETATVKMVHGHGYLKTPRSRNFVASQDGKTFVSGGNATSIPAIEYCPHCLNRGGPLAACGIVDNRNYDTPRNVLGSAMPINVQGIYTMGSTIEVDVVLTAHHMGHFEFHVCPLQSGTEIPTQACFRSNPVRVIRDVLYGAPPDINFPHRAYVPPLTYPGIINDSGGTVPGTLYRYELQLPPTIRGNLVLLQWYYLTGNSCIHPGYETYPFPSAWGGNLPGDLGYCNVDDSDGGNGTPERFWNCAEISIVTNNVPIFKTTSAPLPPPSPPFPTAPYPVSVPSSPVKSPVLSPTIASPTTTTTTNCGGGTIGNGVCTNPVLCCSKWGYCGSTTDYCGINAAPAVSPLIAPVLTSPVVPAPTPPIAMPTTPVKAPVPTPIKAPIQTPVSVPIKVPVQAPALSPIKVGPTATNGTWVLSTSNRCGTSELDARGNCGRVCTVDSQCMTGQWCYGVHANYCDSKPATKYCNTVTMPEQPSSRCGMNEIEARERCGVACTKSTDCAVSNGEHCWAVHANTCNC